MPARRKAQLRTFLLTRRDAFSDEERRLKSDLVATRLISSPLLKRSHALMLYVAFGSEADPQMVMDHALDSGKRVFVPDHAGVIEVGRHDVRRGDPSQIDLVLVPGVAFDLKGDRLGYGGGWYDSFARKLKRSATFVGFAFEEQIVEALPRQPHDIQIDHIVTDRRLIDCRK